MIQVQARWGDIVLFCAQINTDGGRTQVVHEPSSGDRHVVQDRGLRVRRARLQLQFDEFPGAPAPEDAARILEAAKNTGTVRMFTHPLLGRYLASVGEFTSQISDSGVITGEAEFIAESDDIAIAPIGTTLFGDPGAGSVSALAEATDARLDDAGALKMAGPTAAALTPALPSGFSFGSGLAANLSLNLSINLDVQLSASIAANVSATATAAATATASAAASATATGSATAAASAVAVATASASAFAGAAAVADVSVALAASASSDAAAGFFATTTIDARVAVDSWGTGDVPMRQVQIDSARILGNIATCIEAGGMELDLALWPSYRALIMLGDAVRQAAVSATSETPAVFVMRVSTPTSLLPLAARIYGGANAQDRARQVAALNDIPTPGWLPPGDYLMPTRPRAAGR